MPPSGPFALDKSERITGRKMVDALFSGGESRSMSYYPVRAVFRLMPFSGARVRILVSVPKRFLHHAVDRNRVKRQLRESYRLHKEILLAGMSGNAGSTLVVAFIWQGHKVEPSEGVSRRVVSLMTRISEKI